MLTQWYVRGRALVVVLAISAVIGQIAVMAQAVNGTISGTVTDPSGAAIAGATVEVKNTATQVTRTVTTNAQGRYQAPELFVGNYDVRVSMMGFQNSVQTSVPVVVGGERVVDFTMKIGQAQETVTVEAQASQVDTSSSAVSTLVETKQVENLPLNGRNYTQLITLAPGVQAMKPSAPGFYGTGEDYSIGGARPEGQAFLMDNSNVQDFWNHGPGSAVLGTTLGVDAIAEFSIQTNTYSAQFGGSGAAINAVTKSGTNAFHGTLFEYLRNSALDARAFYDPHNLPGFRRNQFGGSVGGPIKRNKAFFFFNYEGLRNNQGLTQVATTPTAAARVGASTPQIQQILDYYPLPTYNIAGGVGNVQQIGTQVGRENYLLGRVDYNISNNDSIFTRYVNDRAFFNDPFSGGPIPLWPETHHTANQYATVEERHLFSPSIFNLARVSFVRTREGSDLTNNEPGLYFYPSNLKNGTLAITGLSPLGSSIFLPFYFVQNKFSEGDDLYWTLGRHSLRFGVDVQRVQSNLNAPGWLGGEYSFSSLPQFLAARPTFFLGPLPNLLDGDRDFREIDVNSYVQDDWKVSSKFTLNIGLRYEFVTNPVTDKHPLYAITNFQTSTNWALVPNVFRNNPSLLNFDPRIGFAYSPFSDNKTSIRGGFGIFHNPIAPRTYASAYYFDPPFSSDFILFPSFPYPNFGAAPGPSQSNGVDYNTDATPYLIQYNFNIQREIAPATILQIGYVGSKGVHLFYQADRNPPVPVIGADGHQVFGTLSPFGILNNPRQNPALGSFNSAQNGANSVYNSLQVTVNRRFQHNVQGQMSYTWSHCIDDSSSTYGLEEGGFPVQNPLNMAADRASCAFDRRHSLIVSALWQIPFHGNFTGHQLFEGWQVTGIANVHSGTPFNIGDGFDQAGTGNIFAYDRPNLNPGYTAGSIVTGTLNNWFNPAAFSLTPVGELGNFGRNVLTGPFFWNIDFSTIKDTKLSERVTLQFRAEFFNILNHADWGLPDAQVFTQAPGGLGNINPIAGRITTLAAPMRQIQFALKLIF